VSAIFEKSVCHSPRMRNYNNFLRRSESDFDLHDLLGDQLFSNFVQIG